MTKKQLPGAPDKQTPKQPYRKPRMTVYGDLRTITQKAGSSNDGFQKPATKK